MSNVRTTQREAVAMAEGSRYELTADDGTPSERIAKRAKLYAQPRVSTLDRAAELLGIPEGELARRVAAAGLEPFAPHASGAPTYRWNSSPPLWKGGNHDVGRGTLVRSGGGNGLRPWEAGTGVNPCQAAGSKRLAPSAGKAGPVL
jgi:hypothetical protein